jgi:hypothetical protein
MENDIKLASLSPGIHLFDKVNEAMLFEFFDQQAEVQQDKPIVMALSPSGGDADIGRRITQEARMWRAGGQEVFFLGKKCVYSAGITAMSLFPRTHCLLVTGCQLLVHERMMMKAPHLEGALAAAVIGGIT